MEKSHSLILHLLVGAPPRESWTVGQPRGWGLMSVALSGFHIPLFLYMSYGEDEPSLSAPV